MATFFFVFCLGFAQPKLEGVLDGRGQEQNAVAGFVFFPGFARTKFTVFLFSILVILYRVRMFLIKGRRVPWPGLLFLCLSFA